MTAGQIKKLGMFLVLKMYLAQTSQAILDSMPGFTNLVAQFNTNVALLNDQLELQETQIQGYAATKKDLKEAMVRLAMSHSYKIIAYANAIEDENLRLEAKYSYTSILNQSDAASHTVCEVIHGIGELHLANLAPYFVSSETLAELKAASNAFMAAIASPKYKSNIKKIATTEIAHLFTKNSAIVVKMTDLVHILTEIQPEFVKGYFISKRIMKVGYKKLAAEIKVVDEDGIGLPKVWISCEELQLKRRTSAKGKIRLRNGSDGVYEIVLRKTGFEKLTKELVLIKGQRMKYTIVLRAVVV